MFIFYKKESPSTTSQLESLGRVKSKRKKRRKTALCADSLRTLQKFENSIASKQDSLPLYRGVKTITFTPS